MKKKNFFLAHKQFTFFLILALLIILGAIFAPVVTGGADPLNGSLTEALEAPSRAHILGTDKMGRDIFTRVIYGARASLSATFGVVALIFLVGTAAGVTAGYFGGWVDGVIMRIADMMLAFPGLVLALAVAGIAEGTVGNPGAGDRGAARSAAGAPDAFFALRSDMLCLRHLPGGQNVLREDGAGPRSVCRKAVIGTSCGAVCAALRGVSS